MTIMDDMKANSAYHFMPGRTDSRFDTIIGLGQFEGDWTRELKEVIRQSHPATLANRGKTSRGDMPQLPELQQGQRTNQEIEKEFFDKTTLDYNRYPIINKSLGVGPVLMKMIKAFKLDAPWNYTVHVQHTGQVFPYHFDHFHNSNAFLGMPKDKIIRVMIMLTDWEPGHMMGYGNFQHTNWKAGDFHTFYHDQVPHYSANAAYTPRVNIMLTGIRTEETEKFFWRARTANTIKVDEL